MTFVATPLSVSLSPSKLAPFEFITISEGTISGLALVETPTASGAGLVWAGFGLSWAADTSGVATSARNPAQ
jgi:hypothetical protein